MRIISGSRKGTKLYTLEGLKTRPTLDKVKEAIFSVISAYIVDSECLDLFSGSGAIGLELLSRGAASVTMNDASSRAIGVIRKNAEKLRFQPKILSFDYRVALSRLGSEGKSFDVIYVDPPFDLNCYDEVVELVEAYKLLREDGVIVLESSLDTPFGQDFDSQNYRIIRRKYGSIAVTLLFKN